MHRFAVFALTFLAIRSLGAQPLPGTARPGGVTMTWPGTLPVGVSGETAKSSVSVSPSWPRMGYHTWTGGYNAWMQPVPAFTFFDPSFPRFVSPAPGPFQGWDLLPPSKDRD